MLESDLKRANRTLVLWFTLPLGALVATVSLVGLAVPELYILETPDWALQSAAQDAVDLFLILPVLVLSGLYTFRGERLAAPVWTGTLIYLVYTFAIYCFSVHFNALFLAYVAVFGLSTYATVYALRNLLNQVPLTPALARPARLLGAYLLIVSVMFYLLWLGDIIPAIAGGYVPSTILSAGVPTNPVHVLDLALVLPGVFIVGILLSRRLPPGLMLAPVVLVFFILMNLTITVIFIAQQSTGTEVSMPVLVLMPAMAVLSLAGLAWLLKALEN